jgi:hypothetical protein
LFRSWWAIAESARALPGEAELAGLAKSAGELAQDAAEQAVATLKENPADPQAAIAVLYAALASNDASLRSAASKSLQASQGDDPSLAQIRTLAAALLAGDATRIDEAPLVEMAASGVQGDDLVALTAIACRRAGGEAWDAFRRQQRDLIGKQPLSGDVVVLVNRLSGASLPLVAQR